MTWLPFQNVKQRKFLSVERYGEMENAAFPILKRKSLRLEEKYISMDQRLWYLPFLVEKITPTYNIWLVVCIAPSRVATAETAVHNPVQEWL